VTERRPAKKTTAKKAAAKRTPAKKTVKKTAPKKVAPPPEPEEDETVPTTVPTGVTIFGVRIRATGVRDAMLFLGGLAGVAYETVVVQADRPTLLLLFAAMMGLPAFLRTDEHRG